MTKKKRELIDLMFDAGITPETWPKKAVYAAQDKDTSTWGENALMFYTDYKVPHVNVGGESFVGEKVGREIKLPELCENWNKTIVHRDEFMKRWNERNPVVDPEGWIQWSGGEMPVEKGTLIDVKYRLGLVNLHVKAGENPSGGSIPRRYAIDFKHDDVPGDIIAYRLHVPQEQKTPQQLALEKFGTYWQENKGVQPVDDCVLIDAIVETGEIMRQYQWKALGLFKIHKWRVHSETNTTTPQSQKEAHTEETKPIQQEVKATDTQIGGDHYTKLAIQPMRYSMENGLDALQHTVIKYVTRFRDKNGIEDLEKAKHCIDMLIEFERGKK